MAKLIILFITLFLVFSTSLRAEKAGSSATYKWTSKTEITRDVINKTVSPDGKVSYKVTKETVKQKPVYVTYSILKATDKDYLVQVVTRDGKDTEPLAISQFLVDRKSGKAVKAVVKSPKDHPISFKPGKDLVHISENMVKDGKKMSMTVEGKTYNCMQGTFNGNEVCSSDEIPGLGIVKANLEDGALELVESSATGAKDLIKKK